MDLSERNEAEETGWRHPWEIARLDFFTRVTRIQPAAPGRVLDIGAGDAWFLDHFVRRFAGCCGIACDVNYSDADLESLGRLRGVTLTRKLPSTSADLVLLLDVIEHVDDDVGLLKDGLARVAAGGRLLVSVPAWPCLFSAHDEYLGHRRRYTPGSLRAAVAAAGGRCLLSGGLFHSLLLPRALHLMLQRTRPSTSGTRYGVGRWTGGALRTPILTKFLVADGRLGLWSARRGLQVPGLSAWCVVERS